MSVAIMVLGIRTRIRVQVSDFQVNSATVAAIWLLPPSEPIYSLVYSTKVINSARCYVRCQRYNSIQKCCKCPSEVLSPLGKSGMVQGIPLDLVIHSQAQKLKSQICLPAFDLFTEGMKGISCLLSTGNLPPHLILKQICFEFCWFPQQLPNRFCGKEILSLTLLT